MAKLKPCPSCGLEVSKAANACPNCGHVLKKNRSGTLGCLFLIILIGSTVYVMNLGEEKKSVGTDKETPVLEVSAQRVCSDYKENEFSATQKYKDKVIVITGTVSSIHTDISDEPVIRLECSQKLVDFQSLHARPAKSQYEKVAGLSKGQSVRLKCRGGTEVVGSPFVEDCVFVE